MSTVNELRTDILALQNQCKMCSDKIVDANARKAIFAARVAAVDQEIASLTTELTSVEGTLENKWIEYDSLVIAP